jgi:hypothetical protein
MQRPKKAKLNLLILPLFLFGASAGSGCKTPVLELPDIQGYQLEANEAKTEVTVSGLAFHSAYAVGETKTRREADALLVKLPLVRPERGLSGSFKRTVSVPPEVKRVLFGERKAEIWKR